MSRILKETLKRGMGLPPNPIQCLFLAWLLATASCVPAEVRETSLETVRLAADAHAQSLAAPSSASASIDGIKRLRGNDSVLKLPVLVSSTRLASPTLIGWDCIPSLAPYGNVRPAARRLGRAPPFAA